MHWHTSLDEALERARERGTPVLLVLGTPWSPGTRALDVGPLSDLGVLGILTERYVCVRVDKDEQPELDRRYRGRGWPSVVWLDHEGEALAHTGYLPADALRERLLLAAERFPDRADEIAGAFEALGPAAHGPEDGLSRELADEVLELLRRSADPVHGGWGKRQKFAHSEALHFALVHWSRTGDPQTLDLVRRTLRAAQDGEIHDRVEGGFYRYAARPDWSAPHHQKLLETNVQRLLSYVEAYQALGEASFRETALGILDWLEGTLFDPGTGAYRASQDEDPTYFNLRTREARAAHGAPAVDPRILTDQNAVAVQALLKAGLVLEDEALDARATGVLEFLLGELWDERQGMRHYWNGAPNLTGLLADQATTLRALVEAMHYLGETRWMEPALRLARRTLEVHQAPDGSLHDRSHDRTERGTLRERPETILANSIFAEALVRLGHMARDRSLVLEARRVLDSFAKDWRRFGHFAAGYGRAVDLCFAHPVHVTVLGARGADDTRQLRRAALRPYVASRVVQTLDPVADAALVRHANLPAEPPDGRARAYVHQGLEAFAETSDPQRLPALMMRMARSD